MLRGNEGSAMNSLSKLIASLAALIASLAFAWIALTITETIPHQVVVKVNLSQPSPAFQ